MRKLIVAGMFLAAIAAGNAKAETTDCTEITSVPTTISSPGIYCLKSDLSSAATTGNLIEIGAHDVTIDFNGHLLDGSAAGTSTQTTAVHAINKRNIIVKNGVIRGVYRGVFFYGSTIPSMNTSLVEDMRLDGVRKWGLYFQGHKLMARNNRITETGSNTSTSTTAIHVGLSEDIIIDKNTVVGVTETTTALAVDVRNSKRVLVVENNLVDVRDANSTRGLVVSNSSDVVIEGNRILNSTGTGDEGMRLPLNNDDVSCIDNFIDGFATAIVGSCDFSSGNLTP